MLLIMITLHASCQLCLGFLWLFLYVCFALRWIETQLVIVVRGEEEERGRFVWVVVPCNRRGNGEREREATLGDYYNAPLSFRCTVL